MLESRGTKRWVDAVKLIIENYNRRTHSTTKKRPNDVAISGAEIKIPKLQKTPQNLHKVPKVGDFVRLNRLRKIFDKEASGTFTKEVFKVIGVNTAFDIPMIRVKDLLGNAVKGSFYPEEYQIITWKTGKRVERILKRRKIKGRPKEYLVSYEGYPANYSEWTTRSK